MLNAFSVSLDGANHSGVLRATSSMERQGFDHAQSIDWNGGTLNAWMYPLQKTEASVEVKTQSGFACCVGPVWYRGRFGNAALVLLLDGIATNGQIDEMELRGNFALFLHSGDRCLLMNDALGLVRLYAADDGLFYSTSWLAACAYLGRMELDEAAAVEYVLLGASHSDRTVARGVTTLQLGHAFDLAGKCSRRRFPIQILEMLDTPDSFDVASEGIGDHLLTVCGEVGSAFPGRIRAALSGGFDSRLIIAGLLACGITPELFVYGESMSEDVLVAGSVADSLGMPLKVVDKGEINRRAPPINLERLVESALFFDGLPNDGIYDPGADQRTRLEQSAGGCIALNGGGGEILRNFFHLPDRVLRIVDVVRAFYRSFDTKVFRDARALAGYQRCLVSSIGRTLGLENVTATQALKREQIELLYPLFRCHYWMGVNNSVGVRHGYYATPLVDLKMLRLTSKLPIAWKNAGRFESYLISRLNRNIAKQSSTYGFRFSDGPNLKARFVEWATCKRPIFARRHINWARRRISRSRAAPDMMARCRSLFPGEWRLDPVLNLERLQDNEAFARALAVEISCRINSL